MISMMIAGFPASAAGVTEFTVQAYILAVEDFSTEVVMEACRYFRRPSDRTYAPSAPELADICRMMSRPERDLDDVTDMRNLISFPQGALPPPGYELVGSLSIDYGHGKIDTRRMTEAERVQLDRDPGLQRRLANKASPELIMRADPGKIAGPAVKPQLQKMGR